MNCARYSAKVCSLVEKELTSEYVLDEVNIPELNVVNEPLDLIVNPFPVPVVPTPLELCDDDTDGFAEFDLTLKDAEIIGTQTNISVTYYETLVDAQANPPVNAIGPLYTNTTPNSQIVIARLENDITGCSDTVELTLIVYGLPVIPTIMDYELCVMIHELCSLSFAYRALFTELV